MVDWSNTWYSLGYMKELSQDQLFKLASPYSLHAVSFVQQGLEFTQAKREESFDMNSQYTSHISGQELSLGLAEFAVQQYGLLAKDVLKEWNVTSTKDFGKIVFSLINVGLMQKSENDTEEDFYNVFDFEEIFHKDNLVRTINMRLP